MANPRVTIIIPAYNAAATLSDTLRAVRLQVGAPPFELLVVDNGSTDGTADLARAGGAVVLHAARRGPAAARNRGLSAATAPIVAHLDSDTIPTRRWLAALVAPFEDPATVIVAGNTQCYPPRTPAERYVAASGLYDTPRAILRDRFPFAPSLNMAVRRSAEIAVGGWTEELLTGEDVDFSHRIIAAFGVPVVYAPEALLYHRTRSTRRALESQARSYGAGAAQVYRRYPDELPWDRGTSVAVGAQLARRLAARLQTRIARSIGRGDERTVEFADYHWLWTVNFWSGFFGWGAPGKGAQANGTSRSSMPNGT